MVRLRSAAPRRSKIVILEDLWRLKMGLHIFRDGQHVFKFSKNLKSHQSCCCVFFETLKSFEAQNADTIFLNIGASKYTRNFGNLTLCPPPFFLEIQLKDHANVFVISICLGNVRFFLAGAYCICREINSLKTI